MKKKINLSAWDGFPRMYPDGLNDVYVSEIEYKGITLSVGDTCIWNDKVEFKIAGIRLNPTLRVYSEENGEFYLAVNCEKIVEE